MSALLHFDLLDQLSFYGSYHHKKGNQIVHAIFVPAIFWSICVWMSYIALPFDLPQLLSGYSVPAWLASCAELNGALLQASIYGAYYIILEPFAGLTWTLFQGWPMWLTASLFRQALPNAWAWAFGVHILGWYMQIHIGHMLIEGRKPALLDSLFQSLALAPLFVWLETLFVIGYRPQLRAALDERVKRNLQDVQSKQEPLLKPPVEGR